MECLKFYEKNSGKKWNKTMSKYALNVQQEIINYNQKQYESRKNKIRKLS